MLALKQETNGRNWNNPGNLQMNFPKKGLGLKIFSSQRLEIKKTNQQSQGPSESNQKVTASL